MDFASDSYNPKIRYTQVRYKWGWLYYVRKRLVFKWKIRSIWVSPSSGPSFTWTDWFCSIPLQSLIALQHRCSFHMVSVIAPKVNNSPYRKALTGLISIDWCFQTKTFITWRTHTNVTFHFSWGLHWRWTDQKSWHSSLCGNMPEFSLFFDSSLHWCLHFSNDISSFNLS